MKLKLGSLGGNMKEREIINKSGKKSKLPFEDIKV